MLRNNFRGDREPRYGSPSEPPLRGGKTRPDRSSLSRVPTRVLTPPLHPKIRIVNPSPGGATYLGYAHARRKVRQGRAEWIKGQPAIRLLQAHQNAPESALGYDQDKRLRPPKELKHVPFTGDVDKLYVRRKCAA